MQRLPVSCRAGLGAVGRRRGLRPVIYATEVVWLQCSCFLAAITFISVLPCLSVDVAGHCAFDDAQNHIACDIHTACNSRQVTYIIYIVCRPAIPICFAYFCNYRFRFLFKMTLFARFEVCIAVWLSYSILLSSDAASLDKGFTC
jgi:hypothetical protein